MPLKELPKALYNLNKHLKEDGILLSTFPNDRNENGPMWDGRWNLSLTDDKH